MSDTPSSPAPNVPSDMDRRNFRSGATSPVGDFEPFEDEAEILGDTTVRDEIYDEEEADGEELFGDNMEADYRPAPHLDRYDMDDLDTEEYSDISQADRAAAEAEMRRRDRDAGVHRDHRDLFYDKSDDEDDIPRAKRRAAEKAAEIGAETETDTEMVESIENLEDTKGHSIKEWVSMLGPRTEISNRFNSFLRTFVD
ncbi:AGAP012691-PA, partial [Anopheles gambiae str. PEST]|uniref:Uncharacterized protein n=3 Tax=gambiae species complex TaxID=44542 RepID=A0A6E8W816_ANOCL